MIATDLHGFLRTRRSIRRFRPEPVPDPVIERILTSAIHAPSAHNRQPWRFRVITSSMTKSCLASAMGADFRRDLTADGVDLEQVEAQVERSYNRITGAPMVIILCMDTSDMDDYPDAARAAAERAGSLQAGAEAMKLELTEQRFDEASERNDRKYYAELMEAADGLQAGQLSGVIPLSDGYALLECLVREEGGYYPIEDVMEDIRFRLTDLKYKQWLEEAVKGADWTVNEEELARIGAV